MKVTEHLLLPDATRNRMLVRNDGDRLSLPSWEVDDIDFAVSIAKVHQLFGVPSAFLRCVALVGDFRTDAAVTTAYEFEAPPLSWNPAPPLEWRTLHYPLAGIAPTDLAGPMIEWAADLRAARFPTNRPPWGRPGWFSEAASWLVEQTSRLGMEPTGSVEQLGGWSLSSILRVETRAGGVVMKAVPPLFHHEPILTLALSAAHPGLVPEVISIEAERGWLVMRAFGGDQLGKEDPSTWGEALTAMARLQRAWVDRRTGLFATGAPDRGLERLRTQTDRIITDEDASPELRPAERDKLVDLIPTFHSLLDRLADLGIPETLVHADFHPWNVQRDGSRLVIFDWSDACVGHPFFDVPTFTDRTEDEAARTAMKSAYLAEWSDVASPEQLAEALAISEPLAQLHLSVSWRAIEAMSDPDEAWAIDGGVERHLRRALATAEGLAVAAR